MPAASVHLVADLQSAIARKAAGWTFVHAGMVAIDGSAVLFTQFEAGGRLQFVPLSSGELVLGLLQHCPGVRGRPSETMAALQAVAGAAQGFRSARGEANATAVELMVRAKQRWS